MKSSSKVTAGAIVIALAAMVAPNRMVSASESKPAVPSSAPPSYLISARGLSTDSFFSQAEGDCTICDNTVSNCGCFFADGSNGGNGYFQFSTGATTAMNWSIELDYNFEPGNDLSTSINNYCYPAQGFGTGEQLNGRKVNAFNFETTGMICATPNGNSNNTGSYVLEGGSSNYSNAIGSGALSIGALSSGGGTFVSQIQFTGNLAQ